MTNARAPFDAYLATLAPVPAARLLAVLALIREAAPHARETITFNMPTFETGQGRVHVGAFKRHIGLYPPVREAALKARAAPWAGEKGNLVFPHDQALPAELIGEVVRARLGVG